MGKKEIPSKKAALAINQPYHFGKVTTVLDNLILFVFLLCCEHEIYPLNRFLSV